jgi:co-chaperonin GroES (HSP10)
MTKVIEKSKAQIKISAFSDVKSIKPVINRLVAEIKSWPAQSEGGLFVTDSYSVVRAEQYITQIGDVGPDVKLVKKGDMAIVSMYSGHHIKTASGDPKIKIIYDTDILAYKTKENMITTDKFNPATFEPGINYILVQLEEESEVISESGIISQTKGTKQSKNDAATMIGKVITLGETNELCKTAGSVKVGDHIVFDSFVGLELASYDISSSTKYRVMFYDDTLGVL